MSSAVKQVSGQGVPVRGNDIDTDRIIPARFLRCVTFDGLGQQAFADDRQQMKGQHPFDQPQYQNAEILVVNNNFGCGSSREHAPQALAKWGIRAVIGESFAEIFQGNCLAMGLPCAIADAETAKTLQDLIEADPEQAITLDLEALTVTCGDWQGTVKIADGPRQMLVSGTWDSCGQLVANAADIQATVSHLPYIAWA